MLNVTIRFENERLRLQGDMAGQFLDRFRSSHSVNGEWVVVTNQDSGYQQVIQKSKILYLDITGLEGKDIQ